MKKRFLNIKPSTIAVLSAYLFTQVASASITKNAEYPAEAGHHSEIVSEMALSLRELLADIGVTDATPQAHELLKHSVTEINADASVKQNTDHLPVYKFKVVITD